MFLTGDHNLGNGSPPTAPFNPQPGTTAGACTSLGTNFPANNSDAVGWMDNCHSKQGNVGLSDGSVQGFSRSKLQEGLKNTGDSGNHGGATFAVVSPNSPAGINRIQLP
jgi:hypothetical protein